MNFYTYTSSRIKWVKKKKLKKGTTKLYRNHEYQVHSHLEEAKCTLLKSLPNFLRFVLFLLGFCWLLDLTAVAFSFELVLFFTLFVHMIQRHTISSVNNVTYKIQIHVFSWRWGQYQFLWFVNAVKYSHGSEWERKWDRQTGQFWKILSKFVLSITEFMKMAITNSEHLLFSFV